MMLFLLNNAYKQCSNSVVVPVIRRLAENIKQLDCNRGK